MKQGIGILTLLFVFSILFGTRFSFYKDVYLEKIEKDGKSIAQYKSDYISKAYNLRLLDNQYKAELDSMSYEEIFHSIRLEEFLYNCRVNINEYDSFKKLGVNCLDMLFEKIPRISNITNSLANKFFYSSIIIVASVVSVRNTNTILTSEVDGENLEFNQYFLQYKVKISEVLKGDYFFNRIPEELIIQTKTGMDSYVEKEYWEGKSGLKKVMYPQKHLKMVKEEKIILLIPCSLGKEAMKSLFEGNINDFNVEILNANNLELVLSEYKEKRTIDEIITFYKKLEEINKSSIFFERSYK